jgi:hypothetical protein
MGKFQLNKEGEDPIKIYEDIFKIAEGTVETHLDKLGRMPKPISREVGDTEDRVTKSYINQLDTVLNLLEDEELAKPHETLNVLNQFTQVEAIASESMGDEARTWWNSLSNSEKDSTMDNIFGDNSFLEENGYDYYDNQYDINDAFASLNVFKQVKSGSWAEDADHITNTFFRESKASEYDSMGMWDEMEVWWNSLPTSEQRDIIAKRGEGWELDRIDENGWETDFASLTDLQGDIVAPEYRVRNGLPEWSDVGLGTLKESKANEIDARYWDNEMNIFDKLGALRDIGADTTDATITKKFSDLPKEIQDEISGFNTDYRIDESKASEGSKASIYDTKEDHNEDSAWNLHSWDIDTGNGMRCGVCDVFKMYNGYNRKPTGESKAKESWSEIESIANEDALGRWEDRVEPWESEDRARQYMAGQDDSELYSMGGGHTSNSNDGSFVNSMGYQLTNQGDRVHHIDLGDMTSNMPYDPTGQSYRDPVWDHTAGEPFSAIYTNDANVIPDVDWRGGLDSQGQSVPRSEWGRLEPAGYGKSQQDHYSWTDNAGGDTYNFDPWATPNG